MIPDMSTNKKFQVKIKVLYYRCWELNVSLVFFAQCYFLVPKD